MCQMFKTPNSFPEFCFRLVRASLYAFTFILCILGMSLVIFAFWYIYEGKDYHLDNSIKFLVFTVSFLIGFVLVVLSMCGLVGVLRESLFLSKLNFIRQYTEDDDIKSLVDTIQSDLKCCGISGPSDWDLNAYYNCSSISTLACSVPASCCFNNQFNDISQKGNMFCGVGIRLDEKKLYHSIHLSGCKYAIYSFLDYKHKLASSILVGFIVPQLMGIILIISFVFLLKYLIFIDSPERDFHYILRFKPFAKKSNNSQSSSRDAGSSRIVFSASSSDESLNVNEYRSSSAINHNKKYYIG